LADSTFLRGTDDGEMKDHQHYKSRLTKESGTKFRNIFGHPEDKQRDIIVPLLLFNMPKPTKP
jgi:hypothetical protein